MLKVELKTHRHRYPFYAGRGLLSLSGHILSRHLPPRSLLVVSDEVVSRLYAEEFLRGLREQGFQPFLYTVKEGEGSKSLANAARLYNAALEAGLDRNSAVTALGGGVAGDLAGFVASTYLRGVPFVQVPTTLLAMVDSSVGGKVAVNHPLGKNLIGTFYQPSLILADLKTLETLPRREYISGLAELLKYGIIRDVKLFTRLEQFLPKHLEEVKSPVGSFASSDNMLKYITRAVMIKGEVVFRDEKESGERRILNFGHTFAHALEAASDFQYYLHGEAVAVGMAMAARLSHLLGLLDARSTERITGLIKRFHVPPPPSGLKVEEVMRAFYYDKKKQGEHPVFILARELGDPFVYKDPPAHLVTAVLEAYLHKGIL